MKNNEEVENLPMDTILWDKMTRDHEGNPMQWKVCGEHQQARNNPNAFIRRIEVVFEMSDEEKLELSEKAGVTVEAVEKMKGYNVISQENMYNYTTNETLARLTFLIWDMENGITPEMSQKLQFLAGEIHEQVVDPEEHKSRLAKLGLTL